MKPLSQLALAASAAAILLCSLTGCSSSTAAPSAHDPSTSPPGAPAAAAPNPKLDMPAVGECRALRSKDVPPAANTTPAIDCSKPHTAITYAVDLLPASVDLVNTPHRQVATLVGNLCRTGFPAAAGGKDLQLTTIGFAFFVPTRSEIKQGAHWYRCDLIAGAMSHHQHRPLTALKESALPLLKTGSVPPRYQLCATDAPMTNVPCTVPHSFRAVALWHPSGDRYPAKAMLNAEGSRGCGNVLGHPYRWGWQWPNRSLWGDPKMRVVVCFKFGS